MNKLQNVIIKGTKDGLTLFLDDLCSYEELKKDLSGKLSSQQPRDGEAQLLNVKVHTGNRYLTFEQQEELKELILRHKNLAVASLESNVLTKQQAEELKDKESVATVARMVRSGQVLKVPGDLLLIGDVNPGGMVMAGGNIFVMGVLKGIAHAGCFGDQDAIIAASGMLPTQLRISHFLRTSPENPGSGANPGEMECAYINEENEMIIDRLQTLASIRPGLTRFEGGR
ncbi:septum site-determining protein MinC [Bacillus sp. B-jedd]|uniref:septum site-determining protein MinC n=1 Tax=Bacillus sp. B-jedd TaxID=1476857 RepID=UPI0005155A44|nr:septum site-determining protein MinC [Bacillus sp. B-jedd]CEG28020.1 cell division regulator (septum placement) [Bacillus sp. B-jedd]